MHPRKSLVLLASLVLASPRVRAQGGDPLSAAEEAWTRVDLPAVRVEAQRALEAGGASPTQLARIHQLLGVACAAAQDTECAREAFGRYLVLTNGRDLEAELSPALRPPYWQARASWQTSHPRLGVTLQREGATMLARIEDGGIARALQVRIRVDGGPFSSRRMRVEPEVRIPLEGVTPGSRVECVVRLFDELGNVVREVGSDAAPMALEAPAAPPAPVVIVAPPAAPPAAPASSPLRPIAIAGFAIGGASLLGAALAFGLRESHASQWNGDACLDGGRTRAENCGGARDAAQNAETWMTVGLVTGGALVAGAVALWLAAPRSPDRAVVSIAPGPGPLGAGLRVRF